MGDRCSLYITFRKSDEPKFCSALGENWYDAVEQEEETWIEVSVEEANYAMYEDREELATAGLVFFGFHGSGGNYKEAIFAACNGVQTEALSYDGRPMIVVDDDGEPDIKMLKEARQYLKAEKEASGIITARDPWAWRKWEAWNNGSVGAGILVYFYATERDYEGNYEGNLLPVEAAP